MLTETNGLILHFCSLQLSSDVAERRTSTDRRRGQGKTMNETMAMGIGVLVMIVVLLPLMALMQAIILRWASKKAVGLELPFGAAFITVFVNLFAGFLLSLPISVAMGMMHTEQSVRSGVNLLLIPVGYLLQAAIISARHGLTYNQALKIVLYMFLLGVAIAVAVAAVCMVLMVGLGAALFASNSH